MKSVILAAGMGIRLNPLSVDLPKSLIEIDGKSLIKRSLNALARAGIKESIVVIGYLGDRIKEHLGDHHMPIKYVYNKDYSTTNTMRSLYEARNLINDDILVLEGDLLFNPDIIKNIISSQYKDLMVISPLTNSGDEVFVSSKDGLKIEKIGKHIEKKDIIGEFIGISKLSKEYAKDVFDFFKKEQDKKGMAYNEEVFVEFSKKYKRPLFPFLIGDSVWIDIDNKKDLDRAKKEIYPKLNLVKEKKL